VISGALVELIAGINFYLYSRCVSQLADFHVRLDLTQRFLLANSICEGLDGDFKQQARSDLVRALAGANASSASSNSRFEMVVGDSPPEFAQ